MLILGSADPDPNPTEDHHGGDFSSYDGTPRDRSRLRRTVARYLVQSGQSDPKTTNEGVDALALTRGPGSCSPTASFCQRFNRIFRLKPDGSPIPPSLGTAVGTYSSQRDADAGGRRHRDRRRVRYRQRRPARRSRGSGSGPPPPPRIARRIDNDRDGAIDRDDSECPQRANACVGAQPPGKGGKTIAKCAKTSEEPA
jgi:hypothetical protein